MSGFSEVLKEIADVAGVSVDQLLKVAGILYLLEKGVLEHAPQKAPHVKDNIERMILHLLSIERALSIRDIEMYLNKPIGEIEEAVRRLEERGEVVSALSPSNLKIVALASDGTMNLLELPEEERAWMIVNAYGNRDKGLSYAKIYSLLKPQQPPQNRPRREATVKEMVLAALKGGPKRRCDLLRELNIPEGSLHWAITELHQAGKIKRVDKGTYALAAETGDHTVA